jgi:enoyl-CoA hydratase/carnithine racemase
VVQRRRRSEGAGADRSRRSAQGAFQIGFVNRLAKPDDLANTDQALAEPIAANDPLSMTAG